MNKVSISYDEMKELACYMLGLDYDKEVNEGCEEDIEDTFYDNFGIDFSSFERVLEVLLPMINVGKSSFGDIYFKGFSKTISEDGKNVDNENS